MGVRNRLDDGEAQAGTCVAGMGAVERLERAPECIARKSITGVLHNE